MAESQPDQSPTPNQLPSGSNSSPPQHWCYQCNKRVSVETLSDLPDVVCFDCKNGFVESISDGPTLGNPLVQVLRLIAQTALEDNAPPPPPLVPSEEDYLRIELDGWDNDDDEDDYDERSVEVIHEDEVENRDQYPEHGSNDAENEPAELRQEDEEEEETLRRRRELLRLRLRDFATRAVSRRNRILDWAEILIGLEDHPFDLRLHVPESETYVGNPGDYVDASGYEALLQNLADSDTGGRRGAPPAAKWMVEILESVSIQKKEETLTCSICKDLVNAGESAKKLPCGHLYHGECILTWLGSRNSCPVCRFELPTDDTEYEEERKRVAAAGLRTVSSSSSGTGASRPND